MKKRPGPDDFELPPETVEEKRLRSQENRRAATLAVVAAGRKRPAKLGSIQAAFDSVGIEEICERVERGDSLTTVCKQLSEELGQALDMGSLHRWVYADDQRCARYLAARKSSAAALDQMALDTLIEAPSDKVEIMRAREIAQHMRWMAKTRDPRQFGDKLEVDSRQQVTHNIAEVDAQLLSLLGRLGGKS